MRKRNSNLELLRIISMCGIISMHYFGMGGAVQNNTFPNFSWFCTHFANSFAVPLVNCFVLITGYFMIDKNKFSLRKSIDCLVITVLYGGISYLITLCIGNNSLSIMGGIEAMFPFIVGKRWFVETYIILILFAPFINKVLRTLTCIKYRILLAVQLSVFCIWYSVGLSSPVLDNGYGIINFLTLYMIGGFIRCNKEEKVLSWKREKYLGIYVMCAIVTFGLSYFINSYGYAFITNIIGASAIFMFFLKWDLGTKLLINKVSKATFDVYFVHSDFNTSYLLFFELLGAKYIVDTPSMIPHLIAVIPAVWIVGYISYKIRTQVFKISIDNWLDKVACINCEIEI